MIRPQGNVLMDLPTETALAEAEIEVPGFVSDLLLLTKARLSLLVLITTLVGFCMASNGPVDWLLLLHTLLGTALVAGSAAVLNQVFESKVDRLMDRTKDRPLPAGRIGNSSALSLGLAMALGGVAWLALAVNLVAASLATLTVVVYLFFYTPLKRRTPFCILVGAISGAIPPVIGWMAASPHFHSGAFILFGVLFLWQMPHFLAIAWLYRDEYAQAGFTMLRRNDIGGLNTAREAFLYSIALVVLTTFPFFFHTATTVYFAGALLLDVFLLACAAQFLLARTRPSARRLFFASIIYLPLLLGLMIFTKA
jgi:protoheme IX farnesyltransferase